MLDTDFESLCTVYNTWINQDEQELFFASIPKEELSENQKLRSLEEDDNEDLNEDDGIEDEIAHDD